MKTMSLDDVACSMEDRVVLLDEEIAELSLLLPGRQAAALERLAHVRSLTLGQLIRLLIRDYLVGLSDPGRVKKPQPPGANAEPPLPEARSASGLPG